MMLRVGQTAAVALTLLGLPLGAAAHVCMDAPLSRVGAGCNFASEQKVGPCGVNKRSTMVTKFKPGEKITVKLNETIDHPSHYRIAFNPEGQDFVDPTTKDDKDGKHPYVLLDGIMDTSAAKQSIEVTLPNVACDKCTLQLIQVMYDKGGNGFGGDDGDGPAEDNDDLYYACADIVLEGEAAGGSTTDGGATSPPKDASAPSAGDSGAGSRTDSGAGPETDPEPEDDEDAEPAGGVDAGRSRDAGSKKDSGSKPPSDDDEPAPGGAGDDGCAVGPRSSGSSVGTALLLALGLIGYRRKRARNSL